MNNPEFVSFLRAYPSYPTTHIIDDLRAAGIAREDHIIFGGIGVEKFEHIFARVFNKLRGRGGHTVQGLIGIGGRVWNKACVRFSDLRTRL